MVGWNKTKKIKKIVPCFYAPEAFPPGRLIIHSVTTDHYLISTRASLPFSSSVFWRPLDRIGYADFYSCNGFFVHSFFLADLFERRDILCVDTVVLYGRSSRSFSSVFIFVSLWIVILPIYWCLFRIVFLDEFQRTHDNFINTSSDRQTDACRVLLYSACL